MTEDQTQNLRRLALSAWLKSNGGARKACVKKGLGRSMESHISQILRGYSFGARAARNIETKLGIPHCLLDSVPPDLDAEKMFSVGVGNKADKQATMLLNGLLSTDAVHIHQYTLGGAPDMRLMLRHQPGQIIGMGVTKPWMNSNMRGYHNADNLRVLTGFGDSMEPTFKAGDPLILDTSITEFIADAIYFFQLDGEGYIKRLQQIPGEGYRVLSANKAYETWIIKPGMDFQILGRVVKTWSGQDFS